jgi:hypothetical protein
MLLIKEAIAHLQYPFRILARNSLLKTKAEECLFDRLVAGDPSVDFARRTSTVLCEKLPMCWHATGPVRLGLA